MKRIRLKDIAYARSGDKGDASNVGIVAYDDAGYAFLKSLLTPSASNPILRKYAMVMLSAMKFRTCVRSTSFCMMRLAVVDRRV